MDLEQFAANGTGCPVIVTDIGQQVVCANGAAGQLLGCDPSELEGTSCFSSVCGEDPFGNRFCHENCALQAMAGAGEPIRQFEMVLRRNDNEPVHVRCTVLVLQQEPGQTYMIHIMTPLVTSSVPASLAGSPAADDIAGRGLAPGNGNGNGNGNGLRGLKLPSPLTNRETEVIQHLSQGRNCQDIADTLFISLPTARNHVQNILRKLEVHSQLEAVAKAQREGML